MTAIRLPTKRVEKPWGRTTLWPGFDDVPEGGKPVGEVWFEAPPEANGKDAALLVKYLFTSDKLSVQVHPDDAYAQAHGHRRGKDEAWVVLGAEPRAAIALGTLMPMRREDLRAAAEDGSIEGKLDWKAVKPGDFYYTPAGTIHAIGPGLTVIELQQNVDLTYRLYDYGSDRELHLDDGIAVADPVPYVAAFVPAEREPGRTILAAGPKFVAERWTRTGEGPLNAGQRVWLVPVTAGASIDGAPMAPGETWLVEEQAALVLGEGSDVVVMYAGDAVAEAIWR